MLFDTSSIISESDGLEWKIFITLFSSVILLRKKGKFSHVMASCLTKWIIVSKYKCIIIKYTNKTSLAGFAKCTLGNLNLKLNFSVLFGLCFYKKYFSRKRIEQYDKANYFWTFHKIPIYKDQKSNTSKWSTLI